MGWRGDLGDLGDVGDLGAGAGVGVGCPGSIAGTIGRSG